VEVFVPPSFFGVFVDELDLLAELDVALPDAVTNIVSMKVLPCALVRVLKTVDSGGAEVGGGVGGGVLEEDGGVGDALV